jgi:drug/metabolite transporter (DMT)-like permease
MSRRAWVLFGLMSLIWGIPYLMIKVAVAEVPVPVLVFARTAIGAAVLLPLAARGGRLRQVLVHWRPLLAFAALEIVLPWYLLTDAERHLSSSMSGLIIAASPIVAVFAARLTGERDRLSGRRLLGLGVGLAGVAVLVGPQLSGGDPLSIVEVLLVAVCYGTAPLIVTRRLADVPALPMTAVCLAAGAVVYSPAAISVWPYTMPSAGVLVAIAGLALICTALGFSVFFALIREAGTSRALVFTYVNPAVAVTAGVLLLGEPVSTPIIVAFALILGGSALATSAQREPVREPVVLPVREEALCASR